MSITFIIKDSVLMSMCSTLEPVIDDKRETEIAVHTRHQLYSDSIT